MQLFELFQKPEQEWARTFAHLINTVRFSLSHIRPLAPQAAGQRRQRKAIMAAVIQQMNASGTSRAAAVPTDRRGCRRITQAIARLVCGRASSCTGGRACDMEMSGGAHVLTLKYVVM